MWDLLRIFNEIKKGICAMKKWRNAINKSLQTISDLQNNLHLCKVFC